MSERGYPAQTAQLVSPDSMGGIIGQTHSHLTETEKRLKHLIQRLAPSNEKSLVEVAKLADNSGMINSAQELRCIASRLLDLCSTLDNLL